MKAKEMQVNCCVRALLRRWPSLPMNATLQQNNGFGRTLAIIKQNTCIKHTRVLLNIKPTCKERKPQWLTSIAVSQLASFRWNCVYVAYSLPVKRNLTGPFLLTPWLDMSLTLIQADYYRKRVECAIELLFGCPQRQIHSEQKIMESRSCGPDVHSPAMSKYIHARAAALTRSSYFYRRKLNHDAPSKDRLTKTSWRSPHFPRTSRARLLLPFQGDLEGKVVSLQATDLRKCGL